jgi:hypothetical protein
MRFGTVILAGVLLSGLAAVRVGTVRAGEDERPAAAKTVKALRYRPKLADSAFEMMHGGGVECDELWFPSRRVVANVTTESGADAEGKFVSRPVMHAFFGDARTKQRDHGIGEEKILPTEEVEVPAEVAERIFELAELTAKQAAMGYEFAQKAIAAKALRWSSPSAEAGQPAPK